MMTKEEKIIDTLINFGKLPTNKISVITGINFYYLKPILDNLTKENLIKCFSETLATYYEATKKGEEFLKNGKR